MVEVIMPPTIGAAIGFITSEPMPDSQRIGTRLASTAQTVMSFGRKRMNSAFNRSFFHIGIRQRFPALKSVFESFVKINDHDDTRLYRDSKECNITDRHSDAEVVVKKPLQEQPPTHRIDGWEDKNQRFGNRVKDQVQQQEDHEENHRKNQLQTLLGTQFQFVLSRPLVSVLRAVEFLLQELVCLSTKPP